MLTDLARARLRDGWDPDAPDPRIEQRSRIIARPFTQMLDDPEMDPDGTATALDILAMHMTVSANQLGQIQEYLLHLRLIGVLLLGLGVYLAWP